jgi:hypothetical protein
MQYTYLHNFGCFRFPGGLLDRGIRDRREREREREREKGVN